MITPAMKSIRTQILTLSLAGLIVLPAYAAAVPGPREKVSDPDLGTPITVERKTHSARAMIPKADLLAMATREQGSVGIGARKGAIRGAAAGAGIGNADQLAARANRDGGDDEGETARLVLLIVSAIAVGIGTGLCIVAGGPTKGEAIVINKTPEAS